MSTKICFVLVTYNRLNDLKITLEAYLNQTHGDFQLIIIDNASTDETFDYIKNWKHKNESKLAIVIKRSNENVGGAGGFSLGIQMALEKEPDYIFLADDDAVPFPDMLEQLLPYAKKYSDDLSVSALCTSVIDQYGFSTVQRGKLKKGIFSIRRVNINELETKNEIFEVDYLTFVGACIKTSTIKQIGLPLTEYFIHEDDAEYSTRMRKIGKILCVTNSKIYHPKAGLNTKNWVEFYTTRNQIDHIKRHYPRRYYIYVIIDRYIKKCSIFATILRHRSIEFRKMNKVAIKDGIHGKLGMDKIYKPGVNVK